MKLVHQVLSNLVDVYVISVIVALFLASIVIYLISYILIISRIQKMLGHVNEAGTGNLEVFIKDSKIDELGELSLGFNNMITNLKKLVINIDNTASKLNQTSEDVAKAADQTTTASQEIAKGVHGISSGEKLSSTEANFYSLKKSNDDLVELVASLNKICTILSANSDKAVNSISSIASVSQETAAISEEISAAAEEQSAIFEGVTESANNLKGLSNELVEVIGLFKFK